MANKLKYKKEYCEEIIKLMAEGYSMEAFAGYIGVHRDTIYDWLKKYPEFAEAKDIGSAKSRYFYEKVSKLGMTGKIPGFNHATWQFNMQNRFEWSAKQKIEENKTVTHQGQIITVDKKDLQERVELIKGKR